MKVYDELKLDMEHQQYFASEIYHNFLIIAISKKDCTVYTHFATNTMKNKLDQKLDSPHIFDISSKLIPLNIMCYCVNSYFRIYFMTKIFVYTFFQNLHQMDEKKIIISQRQYHYLPFFTFFDFFFCYIFGR